MAKLHEVRAMVVATIVECIVYMTEAQVALDSRSNATCQAGEPYSNTACGCST